MQHVLCVSILAFYLVELLLFFPFFLLLLPFLKTHLYAYTIQLGCEFQNLTLCNKTYIIHTYNIHLLAGEEMLPELIGLNLDTPERQKLEHRTWSVNTPNFFKNPAYV